MRLSPSFIFKLVFLFSPVLCYQTTVLATVDYYQVEKTFSVEEVPGDFKTIYQFKAGQLIAVDHITHQITIRKLDGSEHPFKLTAQMLLHTSNLGDKWNGQPPINFANKTTSGTQARFPFSREIKNLNGRAVDKDPQNIVENSLGKPSVTLNQSAIVDTGTKELPEFVLDQNVCFKERGALFGSTCGWTRGDFLSLSQSNNETASASVTDETPVTFEDAYPAAPERPKYHRPKPCAQNFINQEATWRAIAKKIEVEIPPDSSVAKLIGACTVQHTSDNLADQFFDQFRGRNIYDRVALPTVSGMYSKAKKVIKDNGQPMTKQDFIDIDVLARTLYGEMESCSSEPDDTKYMDAVAKVILNRARDAREGAAKKIIPFIGGPQADSRGAISKVALSKQQFSMWNDLEHHNSSDLLTKALCPPDPRENPIEKTAWNNAVSVAMNAVLNPQKFENKTHEVTQRYYTSKMVMPNSRFWVFKEATAAPKIDREALTRKSCMRFWDKTPRPKAKRPAKKAGR